MRPKPAFWIRLPPDVVDAESLSTFLREYAAACAASSEPVAAQLLSTASRIDACAPRDAECLRAVGAWADRQRAETTAPGEWRVWESLAHATDRIADHLEASP